MSCSQILWNGKDGLKATSKVCPALCDGKHRRGPQEVRDAPSTKGHNPPEVHVAHHAVPHGIGTEEEEDEEGAAGGSLHAGEAAAGRPVPQGQPDVLLEETSLQLRTEDAGEAPQLCLT